VWKNYFSSSKAIKFSNILFYDKNIQIVKPEDFIDYKYNILAIIDSPVYIEFLDWFVDLNYPNFDRSFYSIISQNFYDKDLDYAKYNNIKNNQEFTLQKNIN
jgi:hypothetical protein